MKHPPPGQSAIPCSYGKCSCTWVSECFYLIIIKLKSNLISKSNEVKASVSEMVSIPLTFSSSYTSLLSRVGSLTAHLPPRYCWSALWNVYFLGKKLLFILNLHKGISALPMVLMEPTLYFSSFTTSLVLPRPWPS